MSESMLKMLRVDSGSAIPLATQLGQQLTLLIASGRLAEGSTLPPVREMALQLGINLHTVRAAYRQVEEEGLVSSRQGRRTTVLSYDRNRHASQAPNVPSFAIGVVMAAYSPFYAPLLDGVEFASDDPSLILLCNARDDPRLGLEYLDQLIARRVDGIIVVSPAFREEYEEAGGAPPVVYADWPEAPGPSVNFDLEGAGYVATRHLIEHGHRRIGLVTPSTDWSNVAPKFAGFQRALAEADIEVDPGLVAVTGGFGWDDGPAALEELLADPDPPTAIFTMSDTLAIGVLKELSSRGMQVPEDVALTSSDDIAMASVTSPALTTVRLPAYEMGATARTMLDQIKAGQKLGSSSVVLPTELVIRASCGCEG
ncbi:MAG: substrate-binding domain-containing protein [Acidimicrobiia bacterium]